MVQKKAFITGITGQVGSYLSEYLLDLGYKVDGLIRHNSMPNQSRLHNIINHEHLNLVVGDLHDKNSLESAILKSNPDEIYNLAAMSFVQESFKQPFLTADVNSLGSHRIMEIIKQNPHIKMYQSSTSEMFGKVQETPQTETTRFYPRSPYGVSKTYAHYMGVNYRESYDLFISNGIMFNNESPRRGFNFLTRKISLGVALIKHNIIDKLHVGNLDARRDWGFTGDYVKAIHSILQLSEPDDFIIATGRTISVRDFIRQAFEYAGLDFEKHIVVDPKYFRPAEVHTLTGDATKLYNKTGWAPQVNVSALIRLMVDSDIELISKAINDNTVHDYIIYVK